MILKNWSYDFLYLSWKEFDSYLWDVFLWRQIKGFFISQEKFKFLLRDWN